MAHNILVTGAAGYIGGSIVADFLTRKSIQKEHIYAAVRTEEQASALSKLGVNVLRLDLSNEEAIVEALSTHFIDIVIHTASAIDPGVVLPLVKALGKQKQASGKDVYYIHTSALSAFYPNTGWPAGTTSDLGPIFETEKELADSFPVRSTDVAVTETAKQLGVVSLILIPSTVYGRGTGPYNQLSVVLPVYIKAAIEQKAVYQFQPDVAVHGVHISDLTALYSLLVEKIIQKEKIPVGEEGYYYGIAQEHTWHETQSHLAKLLASRDLVKTSEVKKWPSDQAAADALGIPVMFVNVLWNSGGNLRVERPQSIGWKPQWDKAKFLRELDSEIDDVLELGEAKSSLIDSLHQAAKK